MNTEFTLFRVKQGKEARANEWMQILQQRREECVATLKREAMLYESVFKVTHNERLYLAWYSIQGDSPEPVETSEHPIDVLHMQFWRECIDTDMPAIDMEHVVSFAPAEVRVAIEEADD